MKRLAPFELDLFALTAATISAIQIDGFATVPDNNGGQFDFRPGAIYIDPVVIALAQKYSVPFHIPGPIVIGSATGAAAFAAATITTAGTVTAADTVNVTINGHALAAAYTVVSGDTQASVAESVARLIQQDATDLAIVKTSVVGNVILVQAIAAGATGQYTISTTVTGGHTTATVSSANLGGTGAAIVQGQVQLFAAGQVITDLTMIGVVAQSLIPYAMQNPPLAGVRKTQFAFPPP